jgi:peptidoglycan/xylan/chitin deacetylase (PgdA/CDA1 family)
VRLPILMYHEVANDGMVLSVSRRTPHSYVLDYAVFKSQMNHLRDQGYVPVTLSQLLSLLRGEIHFELQATARYIALTFDDGFLGSYEVVFPLLTELGFAATFFLITGSIGDRLMMSWDNAREMSEAGMCFGSHGVTHRPLGQLDGREMRAELETSKNIIEQRVGQAVEFLSLPHGSMPKDYRRTARSVGYRGGCTSEPGLNTPGTDPLLLRRLSVRRETSPERFSAFCEGRTSAYVPDKVRRRFSDFGKRIVGEKRFLRLYNRYFGA